MRFGSCSVGGFAKLAATLADQLDGRRAAREGWVGADAVARHLGVERSFVYEHAAELGAVRLGSGERGRIRFQLRRVDELLAGRAPCLTGTASDELTSTVAAPSAEGA